MAIMPDSCQDNEDAIRRVDDLEHVGGGDLLPERFAQLVEGRRLLLPRLDELTLCLHEAALEVARISVPSRPPAARASRGRSPRVRSSPSGCGASAWSWLVEASSLCEQRESVKFEVRFEGMAE
jgi:hypothetical protein